MHLAGITGLDHQTHLGAGPFPNQVVVHSRNGEQRRYRSHFLVGLAVGQDDDPSAVGDCRRRRATYLFQRGSQPSTSSETRYRQRITLDRNPCGRPLTLSLGSRLTSLASSWLRRIGWGSTIWWQEFWSG